MKEQSELFFLAEKINQAKSPEEVFGSLEGVADKFKHSLTIFRQLAKQTHPDLFNDSEEKKIAGQTFANLSQLWEQAQVKFKDGSYGQITSEVEDLIPIKHGKKEYVISTRFLEGSIFNFYPCTFETSDGKTKGVFKINRDASLNDSLRNEAEILKKLAESEEFKQYHHYFPKLIDSFKYIDPDDPTPRQVNILTAERDLYSIEEVHQAFPDGIDPKDMAWIYRRLLVGLGFTHRQGIVHAAVLPENIFIHDTKHGLVFTDWTNAYQDFRSIVTPLNTNYYDWYPPEVSLKSDPQYFGKDKPTPGLDIFMATRNMIYLLGGDSLASIFPPSVPKKIQLFLRGSMWPAPNRRPQDAWALLEEFDEMIIDLWGPKKFHPFSMPSRFNKNTVW